LPTRGVDDHGGLGLLNQHRDVVAGPGIECSPVNTGDRRRMAVERCRDPFASELGLSDDLLAEKATAADHEKIHAVRLVVDQWPSTCRSTCLA
jgi:hypothetical protein